MDKSAHIKNCPFCGCNEARFEDVGSCWTPLEYVISARMVCENIDCGAQGPVARIEFDALEPKSLKNAAINAWNKR